MPTYEYRCPDGHEFEHFYRKISDAQSELPCPECGKVAERHLSAGAGLEFKGSGFYLTDYGKNAHRKSGGESGTKHGGGEGGDKSVTETSAGAKSAGDNAGGAGDKGDKGGSSGKAADAKPSESSGKSAESKSSNSSSSSSSSGTKSDK
jgi:putative FmdB family regulatory protein